MKDRVPLYPGRVKLTPVSGQENTYDMVRADEPTQEGTPLNKASLLQDETAALYGQGADAVPNDILSILSKAVLSVNGNLQDIGGSNVGIRIATGSYTGTGTYGASNPCSVTFDFVPKFFALYAYTYKSTGNGQPCFVPLIPGVNFPGTGGNKLYTVSGPISYPISAANVQWVVNWANDNTKVSWYYYSSDTPNSQAIGQMNYSGANYYWIAIG